VVLRHDADGAFYNPKFLAFATHYGFRPHVGGRPWHDPVAQPAAGRPTIDAEAPLTVDRSEKFSISGGEGAKVLKKLEHRAVSWSRLRIAENRRFAGRQRKTTA
jgi:hypothetical protein